jgi:hypothetical protein
MEHYDGTYSGEALQTFMKGLRQSDALVQQILQEHGLTTIDPQTWYPLDDARSIYRTVAQRVGDNTLFRVGLEMISSAAFPPDIKDVRGVLALLDVAYKMNARGSNIGGITCTFNDESSATIVFTTPFPCALERGIIQGCCDRFDTQALIEHDPAECRDRGDAHCVYYVSW